MVCANLDNSGEKKMHKTLVGSTLHCLEILSDT